MVEFEQTSAPQARLLRITPAIVRNLVQVIDPAVILAVGFVVYFIYVDYLAGSEVASPYFVCIFTGAAIACFLFHSLDAYEEASLMSRRLGVQRTLAAWAVAYATLLFIALALSVTDEFSRVWAISWFAISGGLLIVSRVCLSEWIQRRAQEGVLAERSIIFGAGDLGQQFAEQIKCLDGSFLKVMGFVDDRTTRIPTASKGFSVLGDTTTLLHLIRSNMVDHVFIALPLDAHDRLKQVIDQLVQTPVRVSLVSSPLGFGIPIHALKYLNRTPTFQIFDKPWSSGPNLSKWLEDRIIAVVTLILTAPVMAAIAIALKFESDGPVFSRSKRLGFDGRPLVLWKFRTTSLGTSVGGESARRAPGNGCQVSPRVTPFGQFLRKSSLEDLPQIFNVLLGDMSIVGPSPHAVAQTETGQQYADIIERYASRQRVKPGITGWAQVNGWQGETDTFEKLKKRVECELYYIENWSVLFDVWIILKTIGLIFSDKSVR